jgi:hypothetical protein
MQSARERVGEQRMLCRTENEHAHAPFAAQSTPPEHVRHPTNEKGHRSATPVQQQGQHKERHQTNSKRKRKSNSTD